MRKRVITNQNYTRYKLLTRRSGRASRHSQISPNSGGGEEKLIAFVMIDDEQRSPKRLSLIYVVWAIIYGNGRLLSVGPFSNRDLGVNEQEQFDETTDCNE